MKKTIFYILTAAAVFVFLSDRLFAQEKRTYNFTDFTGVDAGWGMLISISQGSTYSIEVEADDRDFRVLEVEKKGNVLRFSIDKWSYRKYDDIRIKIKMPVLTELDLSGGSRCRINMNIASKDFSAELSGGAELEGDLTCGDINLGLSGGSVVKFTGKGENLLAKGSGGSVFKLKSFSVRDVDADLSGGSSVSVTMNGTINSDQSGGSNIVYYGKARMGNNDFSGGSGISSGE
ncbi:MAG: head GIN domain-containing protein [Ignavibacteriaceae bacterium]